MSKTTEIPGVSAASEVEAAMTEPQMSANAYIHIFQKPLTT